MRTAIVLLALVSGIVGLADLSGTAQSPLPVVGGAWTFQGPAPITGGEVEGIANGPVSGAVQDIVAHPTNPDVVWIGSTNGGIWKTTNATSAAPHWVPLTDSAHSLQIVSLSLDRTDPTHNTLVAGIGSSSRNVGFRSALGSFLRTTNGGITWTSHTPPSLNSLSVTRLLARGPTMLAITANSAMYRSVDGGASFNALHGSTGLPDGSHFKDLVGDPSNPQVFYAANFTSERGIYKSVDTGATWTKVSTSIVDQAISGIALTDAGLAVGPAGQVFFGILDQGQLKALFRSATGGAPWTQLDTPTTNEHGSVFPLQLTITIGTDSVNNFSIVADPTDPNIVYVGGGRQPLAGDGMASTPNSLGATSRTGRLFRVNAALPPGMQVSSLTHCQTVTSGCSSVSTTSNSAPHSFSRQMIFDANGHILEGDDGGIYRRTNPRGVGDWVSVVGDFAITEMYSVAYDHVSHVIISGNQDVGVSEQASAGAIVWRQVQQGSGGIVAVDDFSSATQSIRYSSEQRLTRFLRRAVDVSGVVTSSVFPPLTVVSGTEVGNPIVAALSVNPVAPQRLVIGKGSSLVYESFDGGDTLRQVPVTTANYGFGPEPILVAGGRSGGADNPDVIYFATTNNVFLRTTPSGALERTFDDVFASTVNDIAVDPADWRTAYAVGSNGRVFATSDAGFEWLEVTGNLAGNVGTSLNRLRAGVVVPGNPGALVVAGPSGVFRMPLDAVGTWQRLGTGLPNVTIWDLDYDSADDVLVAATVGRGVWALRSVGNPAAVPSAPTTVSATATSETTVAVSWTASAGATSYRVYRTADSVSYTLAGSTTNTTFSDTTVSPGAAYVYKVRAFNAAESSDSARDVATAVAFTDPTLTPAISEVRLAHFTELLQAVNAVRSLAGLTSMSFTPPTPSTMITVRAQHLADLRSGLAAARAALGLPAISFTDPVITAGSTTITAAHLTELRDALR